MKKGIQILLVMVMIISILGMAVVGCAKEEAPAKPAVPAKPAPVKPAPTTPTTPAPAKPAPAPSAEVIKWKFQDNITGGVIWDAVAWWCEAVERASGGRLQIEQLPAGTVVKEADYLTALDVNVVQMAKTYPGYYQNFIPEAGVLTSLPAQLSVNDFEYLLYKGGLWEPIREAYAEHGAYYLAAPHAGGFWLWSTKPLNTLEDWKGLKARATGAIQEIMTLAEASPVYIPHAESYTALQLGTIEAYCTVFSIFNGMKHWEICKYITVPALQPVVADGFSLSQKALNDLPEDLRVLVIEMGYALQWREALVAQVDDQKTIANAVPRGVMVTRLPDDDIKKLGEYSARAFEKWAGKSARADRMMDIIKDYMVEMGYSD